MHAPHHTLLDLFAYRSGYKMPSKFHTHPEYEIYFVHTGGCTYLVGETFIELQAGSLLIIDGVNQHGPIGMECCERTMIRFNGGIVAPLLQQLCPLPILEPFQTASFRHLKFEADTLEHIENIFKRLHQYSINRTRFSIHQVHIVFVELLMYIADTYTPEAELLPDQMLKKTYIRKLLTYIDQHYMEELTLEKLADYIHLNKFYMIKLFKEQTELTIFDYINKRRISQAKLLFLFHPHLTATQISNMIGFEQLPHFSRNFKQIVGVTPEQFRRLI